jgi:hypothetical protein
MTILYIEEARKLASLSHPEPCKDYEGPQYLRVESNPSDDTTSSALLAPQPKPPTALPAHPPNVRQGFPCLDGIPSRPQPRLPGPAAGRLAAGRGGWAIVLRISF